MGTKTRGGLVVALALAAAVAPSGAATAAEPLRIHERWVDVLDGMAASHCDGTVLTYSGRVQTIIHIVERADGSFHVTVTANSMGLSAVDASGTTYRDITHAMESKTASGEWVVDDSTGTFTENVVERIHVFAPGGDGVELTRRVAFHVTKTNGELRVVRDTDVTDCS